MPTHLEHAIQFAPGMPVFGCGIFDDIEQYALLVVADLVELGERNLVLSASDMDVVEVFFEGEAEPRATANEIRRRRRLGLPQL